MAIGRARSPTDGVDRAVVTVPEMVSLHFGYCGALWGVACLH